MQPNLLADPDTAAEEHSATFRLDGRPSAPVRLPASSTRGRNLAIDALRGLVIVLMVLDHTRDFFFGMRIKATDLDVASPLLFFTRWVTHFCAPVFVFLAGASAFAYGQRHSRGELTRFLLTRGALLIALELTLVRLCWIPDPFYHFTLLQVIWAIGWSLLLLAAVARWPVAAVLTLAAALTLAQTRLTSLDPAVFGRFDWLFQLLHQRAVFHPTPGRTIALTYPLLPWFAVMLFGYAYGRWLQLPVAARRRRTLALGLLSIAGFVGLRAFTSVGDPQPWTGQPTLLRAVMAFLNCEKYPPSLCYLLMTLGPALCLLAAWEREGAAAPRWQRHLAVFGGVPLFCYVAHLFTLRYVSAPIALARYGMAAFTPPPGRAGSPEFPLWVTYAVWVLATALLYFAARWFLRKKLARPEGLLRYF
jgi:uncharacterized membrane protein